MSQKLSPRDAGAFIAGRSVSVKVKDAAYIASAARKIYERMKELNYSTAVWRTWPLHPKTLSKDTVDWIFVVDCLNFSFWLPGQKQFKLEYRGTEYEDYEALCAAINRALEEGIPLTTPSYYKDVTLDTVKHVFRSCNATVLPLLEQRTKNLNEAGKVLCENYNGSFANLLLRCQNDVTNVIQLVANQFRSFQDEACFEGQKVCFYKRVQILIADIWACFEGESYGKFSNIDELTMFADYRVPQALLALDVMSYSEELMNRLVKQVELANGCREEMEIRGCSIHAVEVLRHEISNLLSLSSKETPINSVIIDFYLWDFATQDADKLTDFPEHRTRSIYY